jgi:hypothetical protein
MDATVQIDVASKCALAESQTGRDLAPRNPHEVGDLLPKCHRCLSSQLIFQQLGLTGHFGFKNAVKTHRMVPMLKAHFALVLGQPYMVLPGPSTSVINTRPCQGLR